MKNKIFLAIDFDGTIANKTGDQLVLIEGAKDAMQKFRDANCYILIDSNRANSYRKKEGTVERSLNEMKEFLDVNQICYDAISGISFPAQGKPIADFYISNHNIEMTTWDNVVVKVLPEIKILTNPEVVI